MLRPCRINNKISADTYFHGLYDYNGVPMRSPGTKVLVHETPGKRRTWSPHGLDGWYVGMAAEYY